MLYAGPMWTFVRRIEKLGSSCKYLVHTQWWLTHIFHNSNDRTTDWNSENFRKSFSFYFLFPIYYSQVTVRFKIAHSCCYSFFSMIQLNFPKTGSMWIVRTQISVAECYFYTFILGNAMHYCYQRVSRAEWIFLMSEMQLIILTKKSSKSFLTFFHKQVQLELPISVSRLFWNI